MNLIIDGSNIISGGGLTHLKEFIKHAEPYKYDFRHVLLWAPSKTLDEVPDRKWLKKKRHKLLEKGYFYRLLWKYFVLKPSLHIKTLLFIPGTGYMQSSAKVVTMCRNLLPLETRELNRFYPSINWVRLIILRFLHIRAFQKADGVLFLNNYCFSKASRLTKKISDYTIIPHGVNEDFRYLRKDYSIKDGFCLLYVSTLDLYKHQWLLAEAVLELRNEGVPVQLVLIGDSYSSTDKKLKEVLRKNKKESDHIEWLGKVPYEQLDEFYKKADAFIYSSTCETFGMTLLEAMASSLPIACSNKSSMSNLLKDGGIYFEPEDVDSIKNVILKLYKNKKKRKELGERAYDISLDYSWKKTANNTFKYLSQIASS